ncbi:MAG: acyl carrier protein [Granulosicoccus sp.]|nr:acyl carrier protein [Granulosicoccus sp.]
MNATQRAVQEELHRIAPDIEFESIDADEDLREEFDMDSMDFLHLVTALGKRFGVPMPEADYPRMSSYNALCSYLDEVIE